jgi:hypothetical protein
MARLLLIKQCTYLEKELCMFSNQSKLFPDSNTLRLILNQLSRNSAAPAGPDYTGSHLRSREEKLTGVLIILSILALILTF